MKLFLFAVIAVLLYNSPEARNATGDILRKTADIVDTNNNTTTITDTKYFKVPNPLY